MIKNSALQVAYDLGRMRALEEARLSKEAALGDKVMGGLLSRTAHLWAPAGAGAVLAGPDNREIGALAGLAGGFAGRGLAKLYARKGLFSPQDMEILNKVTRKKDLAKYEDLAKRYAEFEKSMPMMQLGTGVAGGGAAGHFLNQSSMPPGPGRAPMLAEAPAVSDMGGHYSGLVPEGYY